MLFTAGVASANSDDTDPRVDTSFSFGYDPDAQLFFFKAAEIDSPEAGCELGDATDAAAIEACGITGIPVGTRGKVSHGQIMKAFNEHVDMQGRGCLNRWLAGTNLGKDDQQVKTSDASEEPTATEGGGIDFTTVMASCKHGKDKALFGDEAEGHPGKGRNKDKADSGHGRPESPGKAEQAKAKNKNK